MKNFKVKRTITTVSEVIITAPDLESAEALLEEGDVEFGKEEVLESNDEIETCDPVVTCHVILETIGGTPEDPQVFFTENAAGARLFEIANARKLACTPAAFETWDDFYEYVKDRLDSDDYEIAWYENVEVN